MDSLTGKVFSGGMLMSGLRWRMGAGIDESIRAPGNLLIFKNGPQDIRPEPVFYLNINGRWHSCKRLYSHHTTPDKPLLFLSATV